MEDDSDQAAQPPKKVEPQTRPKQKSPKKSREDKYADARLKYIDNAYDDLPDEREKVVN